MKQTTVFLVFLIQPLNHVDCALRHFEIVIIMQGKNQTLVNEVVVRGSAR